MAVTIDCKAGRPERGALVMCASESLAVRIIGKVLSGWLRRAIPLPTFYAPTRILRKMTYGKRWHMPRGVLKNTSGRLLVDDLSTVRAHTTLAFTPHPLALL